MQVPYGTTVFTSSAFLVFCNRVCNLLFALAMCVCNGERIRNQAPLWKYVLVSVSNVAATTCQYEALKYVSFPVQMLGKSFKMMPVMLWGIVISKKSYSLIDWLVAAAVTSGVTQFLLTGNISSPDASNSEAHSSCKGLLLLVAFLACDGLTSTIQEKLFKEYQTSKFNQMFYVNISSAVTSLIVLLTAGSLSSSIAFCVAHPSFVKDAALLSASATTSQFFIYSQVKDFGALVFAATMNVRQVVSILLSYVHYKHAITKLQIFGLILVFSALFCKSYTGLRSARESVEETTRIVKSADRSGHTISKMHGSSAASV